MCHRKTSRLGGSIHLFHPLISTPASSIWILLLVIHRCLMQQFPTKPRMHHSNSSHPSRISNFEFFQISQTAICLFFSSPPSSHSVPLLAHIVTHSILQNRISIYFSGISFKTFFPSLFRFHIPFDLFAFSVNYCVRFTLSMFHLFSFFIFRRWPQ